MRKLILFNLGFFFFLILIVESTLGILIRSRSGIYSVPYGRANKNIKYDVTKLYESPEKLIINYVTDSLGYRSNSNKNQNLILTVGGSTTAQDYVDEGKTWQDVLDKKFLNKFDFINGGRNGRSSLSHFHSLKNWHSKVLNPKDVKMIIFYIGLNDIHLLDEKFAFSETSANYDDHIQFFLMNARAFLWENSFFYRRLKLAKDKLDYLITGYAKPVNMQRSFYEEKYSLTPKTIKMNKRSEKYILLFSKLLERSKIFFPYSDIVVIQQEAPICKFIDKNKVIEKVKNTDDFCTKLGLVFLNQDLAIEKLKKEFKPTLFKMYLNQIITYDGLYDNVHTVSKGSRQIGEYIFEKIESNKLLKY